MSEPLAYLITFRTYGSWLHGDARGSVTQVQNGFGTPLLAPDRELEEAERRLMTSEPVVLTRRQRDVAAEAARAICVEKSWSLPAVNVRANHVHAVVSAPVRPEAVMHALKSAVTKRLRELGLVGRDRRLWARHGSTRYLWKPWQVRDACRYVAEGQGVDS